MHSDLKSMETPSPVSQTSHGRAMTLLADASDDALFTLHLAANGDWVITESNRATIRLFNAGSEENLRGKSLNDIFGSDAFCEGGRFLPDLCAESGEPQECEAYLAAQGSDYWVVFNWWNLRCVPIASSDATISEMACVCRCTTEKRDLQSDLQKFSSAITQASSIISIVELQGTTVEYINPAFESKTGLSAKDAVGQNIFQLCMPQYGEKLYAPLMAAMERFDPWEGELPSYKCDGSVYWESVRITPIQNNQNTTSHYLFLKEDITDRLAIENNLRLASRALETTDAGVMITDSSSRIISVNPGFTRITGYEEKEVLGKTPQILSSGAHDAQFYQSMWQQLKTQGGWSGEIIDRKKNGETYVESISISTMHDAEGNATHYVGVFSDITELKQSQSQLEQLANYDTLTQLPNRHSLQSRLQRALLRAKREKHHVAVILFDLDHFKAVNDTLGHPAGDALLKEVSKRAQRQLRDEDTLARLGGDEFVAILEGIDSPERISVVAERIIREINLPVVLEGTEVFVGCSLGISFYPKDGIDVDILMRNADLALYRAKGEGKNCYRLYSEEMNASAHKRYQLEVHLRKSVEYGELTVVYQPQFDAKTRKLVGAEALLRWNNSAHGNVSPADFIPIAEQTGLIIPVGKWVFEQVCRMQQSIHASGGTPLKIAVNVSPIQFRQKDLVETFAAVLHSTHVPAEWIEIEVTEGTIMTEVNTAIDTLKQMREMGFSIAIDDFGTGYSSLGYLRKFPIDKIKIDRTFIHELETNEEDAAIISAIIALSNSLGMATLAEGVETEHQLSVLNSVGCGLMQGYLLGRPISESEFRKLLAQASAAAD
jgi:diguanylate cyclase (GGDEF)-like protein/PAS domain S-box-containing protein